MTQQEFQPLIDYVDNWDKIEGVKPKNESEFIINFFKLLQNFPDDREITFDGDGSYFGKQITLEPFSFYGKSPRQLRFEIAYSKDRISVYTANHDGYWNPEFISIDNTKPEFTQLKSDLYKFLTRIFGL